MNITPEMQQVMEEISSFYENRKEALDFLTSWYSSLKAMVHGEVDLRILRDAERTLYEKRLKNRIHRSTELLKVAVDPSRTPLYGYSGRSPYGLYLAELYYTGKGG